MIYLAIISNILKCIIKELICTYLFAIGWTSIKTTIDELPCARNVKGIIIIIIISKEICL